MANRVFDDARRTGPRLDDASAGDGARRADGAGRRRRRMLARARRLFAARGRDAGRAEDPDHPRLLRARSCTRSRSRPNVAGPLRRARRAQRRRAARRAPAGARRRGDCRPDSPLAAPTARIVEEVGVEASASCSAEVRRERAGDLASGPAAMRGRPSHGAPARGCSGLRAARRVAAIDADIDAPAFARWRWPGFADAAGRGSASRMTDLARGVAAAAAGPPRRARGVLSASSSRPRKARHAARDGLCRPKASPPPIRSRLPRRAASRLRRPPPRAAQAGGAARQRTARPAIAEAAASSGYEALKRGRGALDFDDLVDTHPRAALARRRRLGALQARPRHRPHPGRRGAGHQPEQWQILRHLAEEFFAGAGRAARRDPHALRRRRREAVDLLLPGRRAARVRRRARQFGRPRPGAALRFERRPAARSPSARPRRCSRRSTRSSPSRCHPGACPSTMPRSARSTRALGRNAPGRVELWPIIEPPAKIGSRRLGAPVDDRAASRHRSSLAKRIADDRRRLARGEARRRRPRLTRRRHPGPGAQPRRPVRGRHPRPQERGVPVAGADRSSSPSTSRSMDLIAVGRVTLLPDDDLTLATALKSAADRPRRRRPDPHRRRRTRRLAAPGARAPAGATDEVGAARRDALRTLAAARARCTTRSPSSRPLLGPLGGRARSLAPARRRGRRRARRVPAPSPMRGGDRDAVARGLPAPLRVRRSHEVKRDLDAARDEVRVMTVHGAKGLEAPIVILVDSCDVLDARSEARFVVPHAGRHAEFAGLVARGERRSAGGRARPGPRSATAPRGA